MGCQRLRCGECQIPVLNGTTEDIGEWARASCTENGLTRPRLEPCLPCCSPIVVGPAGRA